MITMILSTLIATTLTILPTVNSILISLAMLMMITTVMHQSGDSGSHSSPRIHLSLSV